MDNSHNDKQSADANNVSNSILGSIAHGLGALQDSSLHQVEEEPMSTEDPLSNLVDTSLLVTDGGLHVTIYHEPPSLTGGTAQASSQGGVKGTSGTKGASVPVPGTSGATKEPSIVPGKSGVSAGFGLENFFKTYHVDDSLTWQYLQGKISFLEFSEAMDKAREAQDGPAKGESEDTSGSGNTESPIDTPMEVSDTAKEGSEKPSKEKERKRAFVKRRKLCDLPKHLEPHLGEVNITFAQGDTELAIKQCMELIRNAPQASKPFQTLSMIYEDIGETQKALQFALIAAHLDPSDPEEWARLAEMCVEHNDLNQATKCYSNAVRYAESQEKKADYLWERSILYEQQKEYTKSLEGYQRVLALLPPTDSERYFKLAWSLTRSFYELGEKDQALQTIRKAFQDHPEQITAEDVNLLLELLMPAKHYIESVEVLVKHCGVCFKFPGDVDWSCDKNIDTDLRTINLVPVSCHVPDILAIDLRVKLAVCLICLKYINVVKKMIEPLFEEDIDETGDLHLDVAEAYIENGYYKQAEPILAKLVKSKTYDLAAVWLRYGDCLKALGNVKSAVKAYNRVVDLAPSHIGARLCLSALQQQLGKHDEALEALEHRDIEDRKMSREEMQMLLQKCHLLDSQGKLDEFLECGKQLLFQEWKDVEADEMSYVQAVRTFKHKKEHMLAFFEARGKDISKIEVSMNIGKRRNEEQLPYSDVWELYKKLLTALINAKRYKDVEDLSLFGMMCPIFQQTEDSIKDAELIVMIAALLARNATRAYSVARHLVLQNIDNNQAWNAFLQVIQMCNDSRHNRFCLRRMLHFPENIPLGIMNAHNSMATGSYKHSLGEYGNVFRRQPKDPMLSLCIALDFVHIASQRFAAKRQNVVTQGLAFLNNYVELRGECQETYYNIGRALQQMNISFLAIHYYTKALEMPPCVGERGGMYDLSRDIAFNMSLIYQASGSTDYARYLIAKYCVI